MARTQGSIVAANTKVTYQNSDACQYALVTISGTYGGVQASFQASDDGGTTYYSLGIIKCSDLATVQAATGALVDNSNNAWFANIAGFTHFQVAASAWTSGAAVVKISALAGVVVGMVNGVSQALSFFGIKVFPAVILGGLDSIVGAIVGGLIIGVLENLAEFVDSQYLNWGNLYTVAPFYALIVILMIKPYGLFGTKQIERI